MDFTHVPPTPNSACVRARIGGDCAFPALLSGLRSALMCSAFALSLVATQSVRCLTNVNFRRPWLQISSGGIYNCCARNMGNSAIAGRFSMLSLTKDTHTLKYSKIMINDYIHRCSDEVQGLIDYLGGLFQDAPLLDENLLDECAETVQGYLPQLASKCVSEHFYRKSEALHAKHVLLSQVEDNCNAARDTPISRIAATE